MSIPRQAIIVPDDNTENEPGLFDDDDPFNLPPPLPPLSPQRDDDAPNQDGGGDLAAGDKKELNKKRRVNRSPRPKLDEVRLCNDRGIPALKHLCDDIKFKGKGHEVSDLKLLMQRYEHWAHRLFPKFPFADVVEQVENLGAKKLVQNCIKRIRRGEEGTVEDDNKSDTEIGQINRTEDGDTPSQVNGTPAANNDGTFAVTGQSGGGALTKMQTFGVQVEARDTVVILTPEQQERIRLNRERALAKRKAAQEKRAEQDNSQTDAQLEETEGHAVRANDNAEIAKDGDDTTGDLTLENNPVHANDIEMEDEATDGNASLPQDGELRFGIATDTPTAASVISTNESADGEDNEMGNGATEGLVDGTDIAQNGDSSVPEPVNIDGTALDNDLFGSGNDLPQHRDDLDPGTAHAMEEETSSLSSSVDQSGSRVHHDEALQEEGSKETDTPPTEQAPSENEPDGPQSIEMETLHTSPAEKALSENEPEGPQSNEMETE